MGDALWYLIETKSRLISQRKLTGLKFSTWWAGVPEIEGTGIVGLDRGGCF
jgi:hypothetical protein